MCWIVTGTLVASMPPERPATDRAGVPAATRSAANAAVPSAAMRPSSDRRRRPWPARSRLAMASRLRRITGRAAQMIVSDASSATFAQYSLAIGAISSAPRRPIAIE